MADWLYGTMLATTVRDSLLLTAGLSATHLLGLTLITGGAIVANMRLLGVLLADHAVLTVTRPATRGLLIGLAVSIVTGTLLFAARAPAAAANPTFRLKMLLLAAAAIFQLTVHRSVTSRADTRSGALRATGAIALLLWTGVAVAGAAYILLGEQ